jgi:glycosyltransferase involved in cell wall biosynthesis
MHTFFDLTQFLALPLRSGIQRVSFETVRHWPNHLPLVPVRVSAGRLLHLPDETFRQLHDYFTAAPTVADAAQVWLKRAGRELGEPLPDESIAGSALLNTDVFTGHEQLDFYESLFRAGLGDRVFLLVYDMLPWIEPQWFAQAIITFPLPYLRLLRLVSNLAFISTRTRDDFLMRVLRQKDRRDAGRTGKPIGPVLPLGADGLGRSAPTFDPVGRRFTVIGTLEPRKNVMAVLDAFAQLWTEKVNVELVFAGRMGWLGEDDQRRVRELARSEHHFTWHDHPSDAEVAELIRSCRATLYPSLAEGFGLPPLESLALGVPVIVSDCIPSVRDLGPQGQIRLQTADVDSIRGAVRRMLDDSEARRLREEIARLRLPDWQGFGRGIAAWVVNQGVPEFRHVG